MHFELLGPVELWSAGRSVRIGGPVRSLVLAALLVDAGRTVPPDILVGRVWDDPPSGARDRLYIHLSRLRAVLEAAAAAEGGGAVALERRPGGYRLDLDPDRVDLHRYQRLLVRARAADRAEDSRQALRDALALWRGPALADLTGRWAEDFRDVLAEQRVTTIVRRAEAELALGGDDFVVDLLRQYAYEHPLVEPLAEYLMFALHRVGRSAEALSHYARVRRHLAAEIGAEPGPRLRGLHQAILRSELLDFTRAVAGRELTRPAR